MRRLALVGFLAALLAGCELVTGINEERFVGHIGFPDDLVITLPDSVRAGQDFTVSVRTLGADGCWRKDRTDVTRDGLAATVTPYDLRRGERGVHCTLATVDITHTTSLSFPQPGLAQVTIRGRDGTVLRPVVVD